MLFVPKWVPSHATPRSLADRSTSPSSQARRQALRHGNGLTLWVSPASRLGGCVIAFQMAPGPPSTIGHYPDVSLSQARITAIEVQRAAKQGEGHRRDSESSAAGQGYGRNSGGGCRARAVSRRARLIACRIGPMDGGKALQLGHRDLPRGPFGGGVLPQTSSGSKVPSRLRGISTGGSSNSRLKGLRL